MIFPRFPSSNRKEHPRPTGALAEPHAAQSSRPRIEPSTAARADAPPAEGHSAPGNPSYGAAAWKSGQLFALPFPSRKRP